MSPDEPLRTFISYSRVNQQFAIRLACELKSAGFSIWMDQFDIPTGARWDEEVEKALRECQIFMFIMTPDSIVSENAKDEVGFAIDHGKRILPVLLEECDVPLRLHRLQHVDFTHKSFDEGIDSAKELLSRLVNGFEISAPRTAIISEGAAREKGDTRIPGEAKTIPTRRNIAYRTTHPDSRPREKPARGYKIAGIGIIVVGTVALAVFLTRPFFSVPIPTPSPTPTLTRMHIPSPAATPKPTEIPALPTAVIIPRSFTEAFTSDNAWRSDWILQFRNGTPKEKNNFKYAIADGELVFDLTYKDVWGYFLYDPSTVYDNVVIEVVVAGLRSTTTLGLICQFGDRGWYEFDIDGGGEYHVRYVDHMESDRDEDRFLIVYGFIPGFKDSYATIRENTIRAGCDRDYLSLSVNDAELMEYRPGKHDLGQGRIGLAVRTFDNYPIHVAVKSITVTEP